MFLTKFSTLGHKEQKQEARDQRPRPRERYRDKRMSGRLSAFAALNNSDSEDENQDFESAPLTNQNSTSDLVINLGLGSGNTYNYGVQAFPQEITFNSTVSLVENDNIVHFQGYQLIGLNRAETLIFKGQYTVHVVYGSVTMDMFTINESKSVNVNSSDINSFPCIQTHNTESNIVSPFQKSFNSVIKVFNVTSGNDISGITSLYPHVRNLYNCEHSSNKSTTTFGNFSYSFANLVMPEPNKISTTISSSWMSSFRKLMSDFKSSERSKSVLIIGNKNTGKSTYLKLLTNFILSENLGQSVQILDMDPGQPELCQPSCITLTEMKHPFIGTHDPHLYEAKCVTKYVGFTSPNVQPLNYLYQLGKLLEIVRKDKNKITLINSPGWVKGFGAEIMSILSDSIDISFLVQLTSDDRDLDILREIDWSSDTEILKLESISKSSGFSSYPPPVIRNYKLFSYMHFDQITKKYDFNPLIFKSPYMLPYLGTTNNINKLSTFEGIVGVSIFESDGMPPTSVPQCLECQYAALVTVKTNTLENLIDMNKMISTNKLPNLIDDVKFQKVESKFYGICAIQSVDIKNQVINIYTPIKVEKLIENLLQKDERLLLVKGREDIPIEEMYSSQIIKNDALYWSSFGLGCLPYISPSLNDAVGGKTVGIRRNIQRR